MALTVVAMLGLNAAVIACVLAVPASGVAQGTAIFALKTSMQTGQTGYVDLGEQDVRLPWVTPWPEMGAAVA